MLEKPKLSFDRVSITIKANIELSGKDTQKYPRNVFMIIIIWMVNYELMTGFLLISRNVRHISNWKRRKYFGSIELKLFTH